MPMRLTSPARVRRASLGALVAAMLACSSPGEPDDPTGGCGLGPFPFGPQQEPCPFAPPSALPTAAPGLGADVDRPQDLRYRAGQPPCVLHFRADVWGDRAQAGLFFTIPVNPIDPTLCPARLSLFLSTTPDHETFSAGGAEVQWRAQEYEPVEAGGCREVGPPIEGSAVVAGPCCETTLDSCSRTSSTCFAPPSARTGSSATIASIALLPSCPWTALPPGLCCAARGVPRPRLG
jgi:hypothetical protein